MLSATSVKKAFDLTGRVAIITGGAGLLGVKHGEAIAEMGGIPVLLDLNGDAAEKCAHELSLAYGGPAIGMAVDITLPEQIATARDRIVGEFGAIHILINNATNNPKMENRDINDFSRLENFPLETWNQDIAVGLGGAFLCAQAFGSVMAAAGQGVILNVASDLGLIAPDQRLYRKDGLADGMQPVKPVTYSVVKSGLIGLTRYLATYWADRGVRANAIAPGGVYTGQDDAFVQRLNNLIPLGRMAGQDEYKAAVAFMVSDASSYMTGSVLTIDGGRSCW
mgnify:CR=1 FL=1